MASLNIVDKVVGYFDPRAAVDRAKSRMAMQAYQATGYITGGQRKRTMRSWLPRKKNADMDTLPRRDNSIASCRDLVMNTPLANAPLNRIKSKVVGAGLALQSRIDRRVLAIGDDAADAWERKVEREFAIWANTEKCDIALTQNFYEMQASAIYNCKLSGDVFVAMPYRKKIPGHPYNISIMLIESDNVCNPNGLPDTSRIAAGIEVDSMGAPMYYHIKDITWDNQNPKWIKVPVYGAKSGRRNVLHLYEKLRPGQRRGMPMLAPVVELLKQQSRLSEAALMSTILNEFFTVFVRSDGGESLQEGYVPPDTAVERDSSGNPSNDEDKNIYEMGSGNIIELGENENIEIAESKRPNQHFEVFFNLYTKQLGAALNIPYEELMLNFQASYSAARAALLEAWSFYRAERLWLSRKFCEPIYREWLTEAILKGRVDAPGFFDDPLIQNAWCGSRWVGAGPGMIDPKKEIEAARGAIELTLSTHEDEYVNIHGGNLGDWEGVVNRLGRERKHMEANDVSDSSTNGGATNIDGDALDQVNQQTQDSPEDAINSLNK